MYKGIIFFVWAAVFFASCKEWSDAPQTARDTYLTFFDYIQPFRPVAVTPLDDGFVWAADYPANSSNTRFMKIDGRGNRIWVRDFPKIRVKTILPLPDGGFILAGDSLYDASRNISKIWLIKTNKEGVKQDENTFSVRATGQTEMDAAVFNEIKPDSLVVLGRIIIKDDADFIFIAKVETATLKLRWKRQEAALSQGTGPKLDYKNGKSLLRLADNRIIWASYAQTLEGAGETKNLFGALPVYQPYLPIATFLNSAKAGNISNNGNNGEEYEFKDIATSSSHLSFGALGTYTSPKADGKKSTGMLFARLNRDGSKAPPLNGDGSKEKASSSVLYIDYDPGAKAVKTYNEADRNKVSGTLKGETIALTQDDGYLLAGTFNNTFPARGIENDLDMLIIKLDAFGAVLWSRPFGALGREKPVKIWTNDDGKIIVAGEQDSKGLISGFVLQVHATGEFEIE